VGDITACDSGDTAHRLLALVYEPGGQKRAVGGEAKADYALRGETRHGFAREKSVMVGTVREA